MIHRDIKPVNILIDDYNRLKLADFGCSTEFIDTIVQASTIAGTDDYFAPEIVDKNTNEFSSKIDVWSAGIVLYEMATLKYPFYRIKPLREQIKNSPHIHPENVPAEIVEIIN